MEFNNEKFWDDRDNHPEQINVRSGVQEAAGDHNLNEDDLTRTLFIREKDLHHPVMEGKPMGGQLFGKNNNTPAGDDKNNPSQNAGYTNAYFARTEPMEEHPENSNFKDRHQDGSPNYASAQPRSTFRNETPKPEKVERGNGENDRPHKGNTYQEGTVDNENNNVPGPNEVPDQQKVGENNRYDPYEREHIET
jgi:hypothetical protein